jgi:hypothetical protein
MLNHKERQYEPFIDGSGGNVFAERSLTQTYKLGAGGSFTSLCWWGRGDRIEKLRNGSNELCWCEWLVEKDAVGNTL